MQFSSEISNIYIDWHYHSSSPFSLHFLSSCVLGTFENDSLFSLSHGTLFWMTPYMPASMGATLARLNAPALGSLWYCNDNNWHKQIKFKERKGKDVFYYS